MNHGDLQAIWVVGNYELVNTTKTIDSSMPDSARYTETWKLNNGDFYRVNFRVTKTSNTNYIAHVVKDARFSYTKIEENNKMTNLDELKNMVDIQNSPDYYDYDEYMFGLSIGLGLAYATMIGVEPETVWMKHPEKWLSKNKNLTVEASSQ